MNNHRVKFSPAIRRIPRSCLAGVLAAVMSIPFATAASGQDNSETVVIRQRVLASYEKHIGALHSAIAAAGERKIEVKPGDTLSGILSKEFHVGTSNAPEAYFTFEKNVLERNDLQTPRSLRGNTTIAIPNLPRIALTHPNPAKTLNLIPKVAIGSRLAAILSAQNGRGLAALPPTGQLFVTDKGRRAAQEVFIYREVSKQAAIAAYRSGADVQVAYAPIQINFAQGSGTAASAAISSSDAKIVRTALAKPPKQKPVLIILDDSWPDNRSFRKARNFFASAIYRIRKYFKIRDLPFSKSLMSAKTTRWLNGPRLHKTHAQWIQAAIKPLRTLAPPGGRVRVIYLPLFINQTGAAELLEHIVTLDQVISGLPVRPPDNPVPGDTIKVARKLAHERIAAIARSRTAKIPSTDVAVVKATLFFCQYFSLLEHQSCLVSMSWTTPKFWYRAPVPDDNYGVFVAAAGNGGSHSTDLYTLQLQFAARSMVPPGDVLAVMNIDKHGNAACDSMRLGSDLQDLFAVGYPGSVTPKMCGTSFSAPRVAWLLAARQAMLPPPADETDVGKWRTNFWHEITRDYNSSATSYNRIRFDIKSLFGKIP